MDTLHQFMKTRNLKNVKFVMLVLQKKEHSCSSWRKNTFQMQHLWCKLWRPKKNDKAHCLSSWRKEALDLQYFWCKSYYKTKFEWTHCLSSCKKRSPSNATFAMQILQQKHAWIDTLPLFMKRKINSKIFWTEYQECFQKKI